MVEGESVCLWGVDLPKASLSEVETEYIAGLPHAIPSVEWVWAEMDRVWHELGLDNRKPLTSQPIDAFYEHPVWLMNGAFSAVDPKSSQHRRAIARFIASTKATDIADFGGGFGELATSIVEALPSARVSLIELYPSEATLARLADQQRITFSPTPEEHRYDVIIAQDVLEHVEMPVTLAEHLARSVRPGGIVIFANNFTPVIQCHLPSTFHLHHTFRWVMSALGLEYQGRVDGAEHAQIYVVVGKLRPHLARFAEVVSRGLASLLDSPSAIKKRIGTVKSAS